MIFRIFTFIALSAAIWTADIYYNSQVQPQISVDKALAAVNGKNEDAADQRLQDTAKDALVVIPWVLNAGLFALCFAGPIIKSSRRGQLNYR